MEMSVKYYNTYWILIVPYTFVCVRSNFPNFPTNAQKKKKNIRSSSRAKLLSTVV